MKFPDREFLMGEPFVSYGVGDSEVESSLGVVARGELVHYMVHSVLWE